MIGKLLMTAATLSYSVLPAVMDLSDTHVFHPDWPGHARFHNVWLLAISAGLGLWALILIWRPSSNKIALLHRAGRIGAIVIGGFFAAALSAPFYGGSLADTNGAQPIAEGVYANVIVFALAAAILLIGWFSAVRHIKLKHA